jgi:hypothetical protein
MTIRRYKIQCQIQPPAVSFTWNMYNTCTKSAGHQPKRCKIRQQERLPPPPATEPRIIEYLSIHGGEGVSNINETIISWCAQKIVIYLMLAGSDVGSPPKPCVPRLTTVQRGGVRVLDEPSMVGLMVWEELPSRRPWFGRWSVDYDGESKGRENHRVESGSSWKLLILSMSGRPAQ